MSLPVFCLLIKVNGLLNGFPQNRLCAKFPDQGLPTQWQEMHKRVIRIKLLEASARTFSTRLLATLVGFNLSPHTLSVSKYNFKLESSSKIKSPTKKPKLWFYMHESDQPLGHSISNQVGPGEFPSAKVGIHCCMAAWLLNSGLVNFPPKFELDRIATYPVRAIK